MEGPTVFNSIDGNDLSVPGFSVPVQSYPDYPNDAFVVKYDENGNAQWVNHIGGYKAIATDIATSRYGRVSITGFIGIASRRIISCNSVTRIRQPEAPIGCPMAIAPPLTLIFVPAPWVSARARPPSQPT